MFHGVGHREGLPKERPRPPSPSQLRIQLCNVRELQGSQAAHSGGGDGQTGGPGRRQRLQPRDLPAASRGPRSAPSSADESFHMCAPRCCILILSL